MSVHATCPKCGEQFRRPDGLAGKPEKCPECKFVFRLPSRATSEPLESPASKQPQSSPQDTPEDADFVLNADADAADGPDVTLSDPAELDDDSDTDQTWPSRSDYAPAAASSETGTLPQYSSRGSRHRSSLGRKIAFGLSVVVLGVVLGAIAVIWASSKSDDLAPKGKASNQASSKSATKPQATNTHPETPRSDKQPEPDATGVDKTSEVGKRPETNKGKGA
jgi:hypothetical protein